MKSTQYPITKQEILDVIDRYLSEALARAALGDDAIACLRAAKIIIENADIPDPIPPPPLDNPP
jgi:hypothetical protein